MSGVKGGPRVRVSRLRYYTHPVSFLNKLFELAGSTGVGMR